MSNEVATENDDLNSITQDSQKYKSWFIEILECDNSKLSKSIREKFSKNEIDPELDLLLRRLAEKKPYNMVIPCLRDYLGLSIQNDEQCTKTLNSLKSHLTEPDDKAMIDHIITFINSDEGELADGVIPEIDLMMIVNQIPPEKLPEVYNCIDYVAQIME
jgi:succinate dehydrogenase flavin-adding protein (antitoxin of CptAB toxin-antitoxin module)